ncbi:MAG TPA: hypothetical protein VFX12_00245 [Vicinamibacterales bacterium]|nr:hypothetical protein [Vicinamibacterales bacterium]
MNFGGILLAGFAATILLTTIMSASQGLGFTRMSMPFLLGTIFTPGRDRAMVFGVAAHFVNGMVFALLYGAIFHELGWANTLLGAAMGLVHGFFLLTIGMLILPGIHPHMVSEYYGPTPNRLLQPPGFLALHYGRGTPVSTLIAHVIYGAILGALYKP